MGSIKDWPKLYSQVFRCLKPGGWFEHLDYSIDTKSDDDTLPEWSPWHRWMELFGGAGEKMGQTFRILEDGNSQRWFKETGFERIDHFDWKMPMGAWPKDHKWRTVGAFNKAIAEGSLEGYVLHMLMNVHGWDYESVQVFLVQTRRALRDKSQHTYYSAYEPPVSSSHQLTKAQVRSLGPEAWWSADYGIARGRQQFISMVFCFVRRDAPSVGVSSVFEN